MAKPPSVFTYKDDKFIISIDVKIQSKSLFEGWAKNPSRSLDTSN